MRNEARGPRAPGRGVRAAWRLHPSTSMEVHMSRMAIILVALAACSDNDTDIDPVPPQVDQGNAQGADLAALATSDMTPDNPTTAQGKVADIIMTINNGEVMEAQFALQSSSSPDVTDFAN